jgi:hypothetical protein
MRKQECIHLHALLVEVAREMEERPHGTPVDLTTYRTLGVNPSSVHRSKADHERAILELARAIERSIGEHPTPGTGAL